MSPFRVARYAKSSPMPSEIPGDYPAGRASEVTTRQATPEELERVRALPRPGRQPFVVVRDHRGRIADVWQESERGTER